MNKLDYKWYIVIALGISLAITIILLSTNSISKKDKFDKKIEALNDSILDKEKKLDYYKFSQKQLENQLSVIQQQVVNQKTIINNLKKRLHEKADSVYNLDNQHTTLYISNWLSKRGNTK